MELKKEVAKALASDTKVAIMKSLAERRKMPAELSREKNLSPSTVTEHIKELERLGLVRRNATGHKWVYYELTDMGKSIVSRPKIPVQVFMMFCVGFVMVVASFASVTFTGAGAPLLAAERMASIGAPLASAEQTVSAPQLPEILPIIIFVIGVIFIMLAIRKMVKK
jgi:DNA-binding transcriptional ArsR family regulator